MKRILLALATLLALSATAASSWRTDILADGYMARTVDQGRDYSGPVVSTIIRKLVPDSLRAKAPDGTVPAVLYVHGFNDYFFNAEMGNEFVAHGYDFYAVDLRRYGRSLRKGQPVFDARSLDEYFPDIDSALVAINPAGSRRPTVLMGHSTGGLISAYYIHCRPDAPVDALVLNSPFLDWNLGWKERFIPIISWVGLIDPRLKISQGMSQAYAESLLKDRHGRWTYRTDWKMPQSPDVTAGWIRAITLAQKALRGGHADIRIPILLMYSARSVDGSRWTPEFNRADAVLSVADIARYGRTLGPDVTQIKVVGGLHDLLLSSPGLVAALYPRIFSWLDANLPHRASFRAAALPSAN